MSRRWWWTKGALVADVDIDDDTGSIPSSEDLAEYCSIRLEITQRTRLGDKLHEKTPEEPAYELLEAPAAPKDSKPALWGVSTG